MQVAERPARTPVEARLATGAGLGGNEIGLGATVLVFHVTPKHTVASVWRRGFEVQASITSRVGTWSGVWVTDGFFDQRDCAARSLSIVEIACDAQQLSRFEYVEEGKPYRDWLVPASILNRFSRRCL